MAASSISKSKRVETEESGSWSASGESLHIGRLKPLAYVLALFVKISEDLVVKCAILWA